MLARARRVAVAVLSVGYFGVGYVVAQVTTPHLVLAIGVVLLSVLASPTSAQTAAPAGGLKREVVEALAEQARREAARPLQDAQL